MLFSSHSIQPKRTEVDKLLVETGPPKSILGRLACYMQLDMPTMEEEPPYKIVNPNP